MKKIALASVGLVILALAGILGFSWWGYHSAVQNSGLTTTDRIIGNPAAALTIVEFVDYQCQYCQQLHKTLMSVIADDQDVRIVFRALPWLKDSGEIAAFVVATGKQGKEIELHKALLNQTTPQNLFQVKQVAANIGIDVPQAERDQKDQAVLNQVTENLDYALALRLPSTPALLIGTALYVPTMTAMPTEAQLRTLIEQEKGKN